MRIQCFNLIIIYDFFQNLLAEWFDLINPQFAAGVQNAVEKTRFQDRHRLRLNCRIWCLTAQGVPEIFGLLAFHHSHLVAIR